MDIPNGHTWKCFCTNVLKSSLINETKSVPNANGQWVSRQFTHSLVAKYSTFSSGHYWPDHRDVGMFFTLEGPGFKHHIVFHFFPGNLFWQSNMIVLRGHFIQFWPPTLGLPPMSGLLWTFWILPTLAGSFATWQLE